MTGRLIGIVAALCICCGTLACAPESLLTDDLAQATANGVVDTTVAEITQAYTDNALRTADTYESGKAIALNASDAVTLLCARSEGKQGIVTVTLNGCVIE